MPTCLSGTYADMSDTSGTPSCFPCEVGFKCRGSDQPPEACDYGTWAAAGEATCSDCTLKHATTLATAARSEADCCCKKDYYLTVTDDGTRECASCSDKALRESDATACDAPGIELLTLPLKPGYWRVSGTSTYLRKCPTPEACSGGTICGDSNATEGNGTQWPQRLNATKATCNADADNLCAPHHRGPLCQVCLQGYYQPTKGSLCQGCGGAGNIASYGVSGGLALALISALFGALYVRRLRRRREAANASKGKKKRTLPRDKRPPLRIILWRRLCSDSCRNKLKLVISLIQVVGNFGIVFDVPYPPFYRTVLSWMAVFELDMFAFVPFGCAVNLSFCEPAADQTRDISLPTAHARCCL